MTLPLDHNAGPSRRQFLSSAVAATALSSVSYARVLGANERIGVGYIGYGLIGKRHVLDFQAQPDVQGVAVCDVHRPRLEECHAEVGGDARAYGDFRKLLDDRNVQAVVVSTPDHWHALMTMLACAAGKDVYVEKPLSLFVREGRWMGDVAKRTGRVVQVGTQQRSGPHYQTARQLLQEGAIGTLHSVRMSATRNIMPGFGAPPDSDPPQDLDYDLFLGPAPKRPYNPQRSLYHFRWFWDYSGGQMTNLGQHALDIVHWSLGGEPHSVCSMGGRFALEDNGETPDTQDALFDMRGPERRYTALWSHREASAGLPRIAPIEFYGTHGMLAISRKGFALTPDEKVSPQSKVPQFAGHPTGGVQKVEPKGPAEFWTQRLEDKTGDEQQQFTLHVRNFLDCIKSRATPISDLESAHRVSTQCHLANLSLRLGRQIQWDAANEEAVNDPEVNRHLVRPYRAPWDAELRALGVS
jgi:predicted dehydrogenase